MVWDAALAQADAATSAYFDTLTFVAVGMTKPDRQVNAADMVDPDRPEFAFKGSLDIEPEFTAFSNSSSPNASSRQIRHVSRICMTALVTEWPWMLRQGDQIRSANGLYVVAANPDRDGSPRIAVWLNKVSI